MQNKNDGQLGFLDGLMNSAVSNEFLERLERLIDWPRLAVALERMYPATTGRPPCAPLVLLKMSLLQHCYGLSDPQCEELVADRLSWRRFVGLGLQDRVPDETTLVRFRARLREHGLEEQLLGLINQQLEEQGLILKTCTLVDATLLAAARRAPAKGGGGGGGDDQAGLTVKNGRPHYGYKAPVAVDQTHTLIRKVWLSAANVSDYNGFERVVKGDEAQVVADKAYASHARDRWCEALGISNGILRRRHRWAPLPPAAVASNRKLSRIRSGIEKVFGWWKRCTGYRRVRYVGREPNRLELEFKSICWNLKRLTALRPA